MENSRDQLINLCFISMKNKNINDKKVKERLKLELKEIDNQQDHEYFVNLYNNKIKFKKNENNLLIPFLLDITDEFDMSLEPKYIQGEFPDIDVDYLPVVQNYLRNEWCPKTFGRDKVVNIGNYSTFGIKGAFLDMARVHGVDYQEIQILTKSIEEKDEEGKPLTFEKIVEETPGLSEYCQKNPEVAYAAKRLVNRVRGRGKHAGGTVVSSVKIDNFVPIMIDTDGNPVSGWSEGLQEQDLQPVGLIKFDILSIKDLLRIAHCCNLIQKRHEIKNICALEGCSNWSDTSYLNDPKAIALANKGETRGIFQFESEGMRKLLKSGGVSNFNDLVAYSALWRPATLAAKMHERYIFRKKGKEEWKDTIPECIHSILESTHGVMCYQEQVMKILNVVGDIPLVHCEIIRKAISKKKIEKFAKYKQMFIENGSKKTGWPINSDDNKNMKYLFNLIEFFSGYGFNKSHSTAYTFTSSRLLYLKAHYPLEFFCSTLYLESDEDKVKFYKREAERMGIKINRCDLNKSKANYEIIDDEIYIGFSKIKGIGKEVAEKIVEYQPYTGFYDFLNRFGTDKRVVEPIVNLSVFKESTPNVLTEFYEEFKNFKKGNSGKEKRNVKRREELLDSLKKMSKKPEEITHKFLLSFQENEDLKRLEGIILDDFSVKDFIGVIKKYNKSVLSFEYKVDMISKNTISFDEWECKNTYPIEKWTSIFESEKKHYGFSWNHPLQRSADYIGDRSFNLFKNDEGILTTGVEVMIVKRPEEKLSKKNTRYYKVLVEDEDWNQEEITFWSDDYDKFKDELEYWDDKNSRGNLLKMRVSRPSAGFRTYTFESFPKNIKYKMVPKDKSKDIRLQMMNLPEKK